MLYERALRGHENRLRLMSEDNPPSLEEHTLGAVHLHPHPALLLPSSCPHIFPPSHPQRPLSSFSLAIAKSETLTLTCLLHLTNKQPLTLSFIAPYNPFVTLYLTLPVRNRRRPRYPRSGGQSRQCAGQIRSLGGCQGGLGPSRARVRVDGRGRPPAHPAGHGQSCQCVECTR